MSIGATFTCIAISFHVYFTYLSTKHVMSNFPKRINEVFEFESEDSIQL